MTGPPAEPDQPPATTSAWTTVAVRTGAERAELVADVLWGFEPPAVEEHDDAEGVTLLAGFGTAHVAVEAAAAVTAAGLGTVSLATVTDDGLDAWRAFARVERAGPFLLVPTWLDAPAPGPGEHLLHLDPGRTFGSGSHPTTRLVLARLAALVAPGDSVLDVGCGSGVLAVGAALLGASPVDGIDVDPASPGTTAANAARNGVAGRVHASDRSLADLVADRRRRGEPGYRVVAANLLAPVVVELADDLVAAVAGGGHLVVSGLLADRWRGTVAALGDGLAVVQVDEAEGWVAVTLRATTAADT